MTPELPKSVKSALGSSGESTHPSADVLTAFVERSLGDRERQSVTQHLAGCSECREVVFLTSGLREEEEIEQEQDQDQEMVAAAAYIPEATAFRLHARMERVERPVFAPPPPVPQRGFPFRWAASVVALVVVVGGAVFLYEHRPSEQARSTTEVALAVGSTPAQAPVAREELPMAIQPRNEVAVKKGPEVGAQTPKAKRVAPPEMAMAQPPRADAAADQTLARVSGASSEASADKPAAALKNQGPAAPSRDAANTAVALPPGSVAAARSSAGAVAAAPSPARPAAAPPLAASTQDAMAFNPAEAKAAPQMHTAVRPAVTTLKVSQTWRIGPQGELEHLTPAGWQRVLANEAVAFRAVAVVANIVWAGGSGGTLMRSIDAGQHWERVILPDVGNDGVASVRFQDALRGTVTTDNGTTFVTADGGKNWTKQSE